MTSQPTPLDVIEATLREFGWTADVAVVPLADSILAALDEAGILLVPRANTREGWLHIDDPEWFVADVPNNASDVLPIPVLVFDAPKATG